MTYSDFKKWFEIHQSKFVLGVCFVLVFLAGVGVGRYEKTLRQNNKNQNNYSTNSAKTQNTKLNPEVGDSAVLGAQIKEAKADTAASSTQPNSAECKIKGNIGTGGKIYHLPGGASYKIVKPEMCFNTEDEAVAAGFRKAGR